MNAIADINIISLDDDAPDGIERWFYGGTPPAGDDPAPDCADPAADQRVRGNPAWPSRPRKRPQSRRKAQP